ncbi:hypothetical protein [Clostridium sp.]|uniref:hypothetical protein n=1 Tax=Clostridium sp. TaxID=1506 RepID=UPI003463A68F
MKRNITRDLVFEVILCVLCIVYTIIGFIEGNGHYIFSSLLTLGTIIGIRVFFKLCRISIPNSLNFLIQFFIFISMFLGKINNFYGLISWWDLFLHGMSGPVLVMVGYIIFIRFNNKNIKDNIDPFVITLFALFFSVAMAGCWEIFEFTTDNLLGLNSQGGSLQDTMEDIIAGTLGGLFMVPLLFRYLRYDKGWFFKDLTESMVNIKDKA